MIGQCIVLEEFEERSDIDLFLRPEMSINTKKLS
jgi:hypothetical protein